MNVGHVRYFIDYNFHSRTIYKRKLKKITPKQYVFQGYNEMNEWRFKKDSVRAIGAYRIEMLPDTEESKHQYEMQEKKISII